MKFTGFKIIQSLSFWIETQIHIIRSDREEIINWLLTITCLATLCAVIGFSLGAGMGCMS